MNFALRKGIKVIYVNGNRIELQKHAQYPVPNPLPRMLFHFELAEKLKQQRKREMNPLEITDYYMHAYINLPGYRSKFDIRKQNDKKAVLYVLQRMEKKAGWAIFDFH